MMRLAGTFVIAWAIAGFLLVGWILWLRRNDAGQWRCPECETEFVLLQQKTEPSTIVGPALSTDLQCPECLTCFDLWKPSYKSLRLHPQG